MFSQTLITIAGGIVIVLVALQAMLFVLGSMTRLARERKTQAIALRLFQERVDAVRAVAKKTQDAVSGWNGWRKFEVMKREPEPGDVCSFYLRPHDGKPLPGFKPGQYLTFQLNIPGRDKPLVRCYSLSDGPRNEYYRVSIKRCPAPKGKPEIPPGISSNFFHDHVKEGEILDVRAPGGHFYLDLEATGPVVLIGGGIGITPVLSMINTLTLDGTLKRQVHFFLGVRNSKDHPMKAHLEELTRLHDKLKLHVCYSNPDDKDVKDRDYQHAERVSIDLFKRVLPSNNFDFYLCGPPPMMESIVPGLEAWGVPDERVHFEAFGPASVKKAKKDEPVVVAEAGAAPVTLEVVFAKSNRTCAWTPASGTLLEFAEKNGVTLDSGCRAGNCGTCLTAVKEGEVAYANPPGAAPEKGSCLTCVAVPKTKLVLDA